MDKPFRLCALVGRFQTIHNGHIMIIRTAASLADEVGLFIGSSQESRTWKNPFSYEERAEMLKTVCPDNVKIYPLPDIGVGNNSAWGEYVMKNVMGRFGRLPDLSVSGKEERRASWLEGELGSGTAELYIPKTIAISASEMRELFLRDDFETWKHFTDPVLWPRYGEMRNIVIESKDNLDTASL